jgi:hypothetical protein
MTQEAGKMFVIFQFAPLIIAMWTFDAISVGKGPAYSISFVNGTLGQIREVRADWQAGGIPRHEGAVATMRAGIEAEFSDEPRPIPEKATVSWIAADGTPHHRDVEVSKLIRDPAGFAGIVYFKIVGDGDVKVVPLTREEIHRLLLAHKRFP